jgi:putative glutamine amidotransferase
VPGVSVPLVGVTTYRQHASWATWDRPGAVVQTSYVDCVTGGGGRAVMLPPLEGPGELVGSLGPRVADSAVLVAARLDALVLVGGADVDPSRYGQKRSEKTVETHPWRDENEIRLLDCFLQAGKPVLGVCRGAQVLNTFLGGTLYQHLPDVIGSSAHQPGPGEFGERKIWSEPGSKVSQVIGDTFSVLCSHHQAMDRLGSGLAATAHTEDGVIEAVELAGGFVVGVQWHPEQSGDTRLFRALVEAC